jgi:uncharacterized CHY-type Zn-finger protein
LSKQNVVGERDALLLDPDVQALIQRMVDQGVYSITSKLDKTGIVFPALKELFPTKPEKEISEFLSRLTRVGILKSKLLDKVIICPTCGSASVFSKYNCPRCSSFDIGKAVIIEHIRCGFIGSKDKFQTGDLLFCPKCKNLVTENDYRKIGTSFECNSCGTRFEAPRMSHRCSSCEDVFTYKEARYEPVFEYELSEETKKSVAKGTLPLSSIISTLKENGFDVGSRRELLGKSGATHSFDIVARKGSILVVANFAFEPKEEDIIGLFAKKYDVDPNLTVLIALTPPTREEETVSRAYGVKIVSPTSMSTIGKQIVELVDSNTAQEKPEMNSTLTQEEQTSPPGSEPEPKGEATGGTFNEGLDENF